MIPNKNKGKMKKNLSVFSFMLCIIIIGAMGLYYQYMKKQQIKTEVQTPTTEVEKLSAKDLEVGYPETPTEVMKLWGRINQCMYNSKLSDEEFQKLLSQLRVMFSTELLEQNKESDHSQKLRKEIETFKSNKYKIVNYSAETGTSVKYKKINAKECAYARISFFINKNGKYTKNFENFILVKENDKWKIMGFKESKTEDSTKKEAAVKQSS